MNIKRHDWQDPLIAGSNRVLTHTPLGAYPDENCAKCSKLSPFSKSLNGNWSFKLTESPEKQPAGFLNGKGSGWLDMSVPSNWQLDERVDDQPIYTNVNYPFEIYGKNGVVPPELPDINPTGWYHRNFEVPADWRHREVFIHFESCDSACKVWVNGKEVGYSQDSKLPHEFNISAYVKTGKNQLSVMVPRYCDGFWLEDQDYWHISGIQRDVTLYSKPNVHIRDYVVRTEFDEHYENAELIVKAYINDPPDLIQNHSIEIQLFDPQGCKVLAKPLETSVASMSPMYGGEEEYGCATFNVFISKPEIWTAETPYLYNLVLSLKNPKEEKIDFESCRVGFRQIEIKDGQLMLNGRRMIVRGVNAHEHHPERGRAMTADDIREEIIAMKQLNFNAVRTSHYPHHTHFYDLCDELGMYVIDEANLETHGVHAHLSKDPLWMNAYMERAQRMALRDKNHPSIVAWSLGNESYYGPNHAGMAAWLRQFDPTRPVQYESGFPGANITDIMVPMYPKLDWIQDILTDPDENRPFIMCEYAYSKGNALGNFQKYWDLIDKFPRFQGGFIWDWREKTLMKKVKGKYQHAYGSEFDNGIGPDGYNYGIKENSQMCCNGIVNADLEPKPGAWEVKNLQAPIAFVSENREDLLKGKITIWNKYLVSDLSHLEIHWQITVDGKELENGVIEPPNVKSGQKGSIGIPLSSLKQSSGGEFRLNLTAKCVERTSWSPKNHPIAWKQFSLPVEEVKPSKITESRKDPDFSIIEDDNRIEFITKNAKIVFDCRLGVLTEISNSETNLLAAPLEHSFMRARTDNDYIIGHKGSYFQSWKDAGIDNLQTEVLQCKKAILKDSGVAIYCQARHSAEGSKQFIISTSNYMILSDGKIIIENCIDTSAVKVASLPRVGMKTALSGNFQRLQWYGRGPYENYCDRKNSTMIGIYDSTVKRQFFPFIDPCECGGHQDTRWVKLLDRQKKGIEVKGCPLIHFSALPYGIEELIYAGHIYELPNSEKVHLNIDGLHMGMGGDTGWTLNVHDEYLIPPGVYRYGFEINIL